MLAKVSRNAGVCATTATDLADALGQVGERATVLICGSLYLAGEALRLNDEAPD